MSTRSKVLIKLVVTLALLAFLAYRMDLAQFWDVLVSARWGFVAAAVGIHLGTALISVVRWRILLANFQINTPLRALTQITFIGYFFNLFLPSGFGGDFFRAYYLGKREKRGMSTTLTTMFLDRSSGLFGLLLIGTVSVLFNPLEVEGYPLLPLFLLMIVGFLGGVAILFNDRTHGLLKKMLERLKREDIEKKMELVASGLASLRRNPAAIAWILGLSLLIQFVVVIMMWVAALALKLEAPFYVFLIFIPIINLSLAVPLTINGLGLRESVYYLLFSQIGVPVETAVTLSLLNFFIMAMTALPGGVVYSLYKKEEPGLVPAKIGDRLEP